MASADSIMKISIYLLLLLLTSFCSSPKQVQQSKLSERAELGKHFEVSGVEGSFLLFDQQQQQWISYNKERNQQGFLPASTFKILNSLIALETGLVQDSSTILPWDGTKRWNDNWNRDLSLKDAFAVSCVPCYQELARKAGLERMQQYVASSAYGKMDIRPETLDNFWLVGNSRITPFEQINFLQRLYDAKLPFSAHSLQQLKAIMLRNTGDNYKIYAKTGLTEQEGRNIGWYIGYVEKAGKPYFFALNIEKDSKQSNPKFFDARINITEAILKELNVL